MPESPAERARSARRRQTPEYKAYQREYQRAYYHKMRAKKREQMQARSRLVRYGLTPEQFDALMDKQDGECAICTRMLVKPFVDHSHATGQVRGLLCGRCNTAIGMLDDEPTALMKAAEYLLNSGLSGSNSMRSSVYLSVH